MLETVLLVMNSIRAYEEDILLQPDFIRSFKKQEPLSANLQKDAIFSGSGDSLVSALLAESFSDGAARAIDPLDLYHNPSLAKSKCVYLVSISGNTITNIKTAGIATKSVAITSSPQSRLAKVSDKTILLDYPHRGVFTAGSISFLASALTCISLVKDIAIPDVSLFDKAAASAKNARVSGRIFVLGNFYTFPIAMYCASKFYEILGHAVHYCRLEQFSHMELFSAEKDDTVIIFEEKNTHSRQLEHNLQRIGINVIHPDIPSENLSQVIYCTAFSQMLSLCAAKKRHKDECHFVTAEKIRDVSNGMIY